MACTLRFPHSPVLTARLIRASIGQPMPVYRTVFLSRDPRRALFYAIPHRKRPVDDRNQFFSESFLITNGVFLMINKAFGIRNGMCFIRTGLFWADLSLKNRWR
jgi:hypothetical protein